MKKLDEMINWDIVNEQAFPVEDRMDRITVAIDGLTERILRINLLDEEGRAKIPHCEDMLEMLNGELDRAYEMREMYFRIEAMRELLRPETDFK